MGNVMYEEKIEENKKAFKVLKDNKLLCSAANRAYYYCYNKLLKYIDDKEILVEEKLGSHKDEICAIKLYLAKEDKRLSMNFNRDINAIKDIREKADYTDLEINLDDMSSCFKSMTAMDIYLK